MGKDKNAGGKGKGSKDKGKGKEKGKGADKEKNDSGSKQKGAMSINVRHILVRCPEAHFGSPNRPLPADFGVQCEKHSKKEEALAKLVEGAKFDEVARDFSEDKARQGEMVDAVSIFLMGCAKLMIF